MCQFFSCLVTKTGQVLWDGHTDSHEDLVRVFQPGRDEGETFARVGFLPPGVGGVFAPSTEWTLALNQRVVPSWWEDQSSTLLETLRGLVQRFQTVPAGGLALCGPVIISAGSVEIRAGKCFASGSATVRAYDSATVKAWGSATVEAYDSATVRAYDSATVMAHGSATVKAYDSATVEAYDFATVEAYGSATAEAYNSATVEAYDIATVRAYGSATVMAHASATVLAHDSAAVKAYGLATAEAYDFATVKRF